MENTKKVSFITLGCKVNQYETNSMIQDFKNAGFEVNLENLNSDIVVVNTCTVTNIADRKSRQMLKKSKKENPEAIVVCTGCMAEVSKEDIPDYIDIMVGNRGKINIAEYVVNYIDNNFEEYDEEKSQNYGEFEAVTYTDNARAVLKIQDGCNMFCTYCIIPYARGRICSRKKENILKEAKAIIARGIKEIVLTGIHIASYGKEKNDKNEYINQEGKEYFLIDLLEDLNELEGLDRIRLGSIEPKLMTKEFLNRLKNLDKVCHHFHLSLQSAENSILKKMNRKYSIEEFINIVHDIRETFKDSMLTTDIIVGFPGETEESFKTTYENLEKIEFMKMHIFQYSERKGTPAVKFNGKVIPEIKKQRARLLSKLSNDCELKTVSEFINEIKDEDFIEVLIEQEKENSYFGYTRNYIGVEIPKKIVNNEFVKNRKKNIKKKREFAILNDEMELFKDDSIIGNIFRVYIQEIIYDEKNGEARLLCK